MLDFESLGKSENPKNTFKKVSVCPSFFSFYYRKIYDVMHRSELNFIYIKWRPNESGIAIVTPPFEEKDVCVYIYRGIRVLRMHAIPSDPASCEYDSIGVC